MKTRRPRPLDDGAKILAYFNIKDPPNQLRLEYIIFPMLESKPMTEMLLREREVEELEKQSQPMHPWSDALDKIEIIRQKSETNSLKDKDIREMTGGFKLVQWTIINTAAEMTVRYLRKKKGNLLADGLSTIPQQSQRAIDPDEAIERTSMSEFLRSTYNLSNKTLAKLITHYKPRSGR